jgi:hypothetical protein
MNRKDSKKNKKIKKLIAICSLTSFIFVVATYAWFIGMRQVNVQSFEIEIASTDSLLLSLDGSKWDTTVAIDSSNFKNVSYEGNVNNWANYGSSNAGLKPISSIGEIDTGSSTMKMYEKGSLTATPGGYRLLASRIHNYQTNAQYAGAINSAGYNTENGGYVAFDLFVRNFSGQAYYSENNILNEEAIYLTTDSNVSVGSNGIQDTGIENSVRVGFAQIGRVNGKTTDVATITGIKCQPGEGSPVTGICRTAQIWEPNDTAHVAAAINYYNTSCRLRPTNAENASTITDITLPSSYTANSTCGSVANGVARNTYAIGRVVDIADKVDVYDGAQYNGYGATTRTTYSGEQPLYAFDYFTDTEKDLTGMSRPTFMTLAPNSITKVRVYVWIEGQDIDNYDFSSIGKQIKVQFGFTKERFTEAEAQNSDGVNGPSMPTGDEVKPVFDGVPATKTFSIAEAKAYDPLTGVSVSDVGGEATEAACTTNGGTWSDNKCTYDLTTKIQVTNPLKDITSGGTYIVRYLVSDWQGNYAEAFTTVTVSE